MSKKSKERYLQRVREALETDPKEMTLGEYIAALEEIQSEVEASLEAARAVEGVRP